MIEELAVTLPHLLAAEERAARLTPLRNSITNGAATTHGFLGEILLCERINATLCDTYDYDMLKGTVRIDAKTKRCNTPPHPNYICPIPAYNTFQACDFYVFLRILNDFSRAWLLGGIKKSRFFTQAIFFKAGEPDPAHPQFHFACDTYAIPVSQLSPIKPAHSTCRAPKVL